MNKFAIAAVAATIATSANAAQVVNEISVDTKKNIIAACNGELVATDVVTQTVNNLFKAATFVVADLIDDDKCNGIILDNYYTVYNNQFFSWSFDEIRAAGDDFKYVVAEELATAEVTVTFENAKQALLDATLNGGDVVAAAEEVRTSSEVIERITEIVRTEVVTETVTVTVDNTDYDAVARAEAARDAAIADRDAAVAARMQAEAALADARAEIVRLLNDVNTLTADLNAATARVTALEADVAAANVVIAERDATIAAVAALTDSKADQRDADGNGYSAYAATGSATAESAIYGHRQSDGSILFSFTAGINGLTAERSLTRNLNADVVVDGTLYTVVNGRVTVSYDVTQGAGLGVNHVGEERLLVADLSGDLADRIATIVATSGTIAQAAEAAYKAGYGDGYGDGYADGYRDGFADGVAHAQSQL